MTNMEMTTHESHVKEVGQGIYIAQLHLYMAGPWKITVMAQAKGFAPLQRVLLAQVLLTAAMPSATVGTGLRLRPCLEQALQLNTASEFKFHKRIGKGSKLIVMLAHQR